MTRLFSNSGPYEISISQYGSTLADLPIRFARQFGATFNHVDIILGATVGGLALWYVLDRFLKITPRKLLKMIPIVGKSL